MKNTVYGVGIVAGKQAGVGQLPLPQFGPSKNFLLKKIFYQKKNTKFAAENVAFGKNLGAKN